MELLCAKVPSGMTLENSEERIMNQMQKRHNVLMVVFIIYFVCVGFRLWEYFVLRTDQTWIGEAIVHKLIGIGILFLAMKSLHVSKQEIGYCGEKIWSNLAKGLAFGMGIFVIAYAVEVGLMASKGNFRGLQFFVSTYAVDRNIGNRTAIVFFLICILGNVVNVIMEEGIFRGLFTQILQQRFSFFSAAVISSVLFGLWHMVGPIRGYLDGTMSMGGMIANAIMLVVTSGLVGFKFALLTKMTGSLYMALGDHFVNNTIVNLLHVMSDTGVDELMVVRVAIAQSLSCMIVIGRYLQSSNTLILCYNTNRRNNTE